MKLETPLIVRYLDGSTSQIGGFSLADEIAFERHFGIAVATLADERRTEWVAFLAFRVIARQGDARASDFESWVSLVDDFDVEEEETTDAGKVPEPAEPGAP